LKGLGDGAAVRRQAAERDDASARSHGAHFRELEGIAPEFGANSRGREDAREMAGFICVPVDEKDWPRSGFCQ
jgi:hypothetical protein